MTFACSYSFDWGVFWSAASAVATAAAAIIALILPQRMDARAEKRAASERRRSELSAITEICDAIYEALDQHFTLAEILVSSARAGASRLPSLMVDANNTKTVLGILARRPGLSDGIVTAGVAAEWLAARTAVGAESAPTGDLNWDGAKNMTWHVHAVAHAARERASRVAIYHGLDDVRSRLARFDDRFKQFASWL